MNLIVRWQLLQIVFDKTFTNKAGKKSLISDKIIKKFADLFQMNLTSKAEQSDY